MAKTLPRPVGIPETFLTLKEATGVFDVSERTLKRDKASGRINPHKDKRGWNYFDPADLSREYAPREQVGTGDKLGQNGDLAQPDTSDNTVALREKVRGLEREVEVLKQLEQGKDREIERIERDKSDLRGERDRLIGIVEKQTMLIEDKREREKPEEQERKSSDRWLVYGLAVAVSLVITATEYVLFKLWTMSQ